MNLPLMLAVPLEWLVEMWAVHSADWMVESSIMIHGVGGAMGRELFLDNDTCIGLGSAGWGTPAGIFGCDG